MGYIQSSLFTEDTLASLSVMPGSDAARMTTVTSGLNCIALLNPSGPVGLLARMLLGTSAWGSTMSYLTWKASTTKRKQLFFRLRPSAPRINVNESLLWPTIRATDGEKGGPNQRGSKGGLRIAGGGPSLADTTCELLHGSGREGRGRGELADGCIELADTTGERPGEAREYIERSDEWTAGSREALADTNGQRQQELDAAASGPGVGYGPGSALAGGIQPIAGPAQSRMGRSFDELSAWMDGRGVNPLDALADLIASYPQPAPRGAPQHDWEPPRVATGIRNRSARLKALGNAVDPLQIFPILYAIKLIDDSKKR